MVSSALMVPPDTSSIPDGLLPYILVLFGGGGIVGLVLKSIYGQRTAASDAFIDGHQTAEDKADDRITKLEEDFDKRLREQEERHQEEMRRIDNHLSLLHRAVTKLVGLVAPEHMAEALQIVIELGVALPRSFTEAVQNASQVVDVETRLEPDGDEGLPDAILRVTPLDDS